MSEVASLHCACCHTSVFMLSACPAVVAKSAIDSTVVCPLDGSPWWVEHVKYVSKYVAGRRVRPALFEWQLNKRVPGPATA